MLEKFSGNKDKVKAYFEIKNYLSRTVGIKELGGIMQKYNLMLEGVEQTQAFFDLLMLAANNTRRWENNGNTPQELMKLRSEKQPQEPVLNKRIKVNRNDKCPCGSGKKYKRN